MQVATLPSHIRVPCPLSDLGICNACNVVRQLFRALLLWVCVHSQVITKKGMQRRHVEWPHWECGQGGYVEAALWHRHGRTLVSPCAKPPICFGAITEHCIQPNCSKILQGPTQSLFNLGWSQVIVLFCFT